MSKTRLRLLTSSGLLLAVGPFIAESAYAQSAPSAYTSATRYDRLSRVVGTIAPDPDGTGPLPFPATRNTYDNAGNLTKVETGSLSSWQSENIAPTNWTGFTVNSTVAYEYDAIGRKIAQRAKGADLVTVSLTQFSYNASGEIECTAVRMNPSYFDSPPASACALGIPGSAGNDRITRIVYNQPGQVQKVQDAVGTAAQRDSVSYTYSPNWKQTSITDARGMRAGLEYDGLDRLRRWYLPDKVYAQTASATDYEEYGYDANGNRTSLRKRDGSTLTFQYDQLNRLIVKVVPERGDLSANNTRDVYYGYDLRGLPTFARFDSGSGQGITNSYNGFGELTGSTLTMDGSWVLGHAYDRNGNRTVTTFPDGNYATYQYDGLNRPVAVLRSGSSPIASYGYDAVGRVNNFNGGITTSYGYDAASRLTSITSNLPASTYNNQFTLGYNAAGQIVQSSRSNDAFAWTLHANVDRDYAVNGINQYTTAGPATFAYDANGNLKGDGANSYTYDVENRLVSVAGAKNATLRYDPLGRLYEVASQAGTTRFIHDGADLIAEYDGNGIMQRRYVHGPSLGADDPIAWYEGSAYGDANERLLRGDWQGSIVLATDHSASTVIAVNSYDEYGRPQTGNLGRFQYTGQAWLSELGMYYYKARMYSPTLGRFMQTDPIGYADQMNLYGYVGNNPVGRRDPSGLAGDCYWGTGMVGYQPLVCPSGDFKNYSDPSWTTYALPKQTNRIPLPPSRSCGKGRRITFSPYALGVTGFLFFGGLSAGAEAGISIPVSALEGDFRGTQLYGSASGSLLIGLGLFVGGGPNYSAGYSDKALETGPSLTPTGGAALAWAAGGEIQASGDSASLSASGGGGLRAGFGGYAAPLGIKASINVASPELCY